MVPWYSGTSADLFKTMFDLLISVKLFLGRFDMRTMQVSVGWEMSLILMHRGGWGGWKECWVKLGVGGIPDLGHGVIR
jgi:hypothetical protein